MKEYFKNSIVFYYRHLENNGVSDPVKVMISDFVDTVKITDEQSKFIKSASKIENDTLGNILILLAKMKMDKKYDENTITIIEKSIRNLKGC